MSPLPLGENMYMGFVTLDIKSVLGWTAEKRLSRRMYPVTRYQKGGQENNNIDLVIAVGRNLIAPYASKK